MLPDGCPFDFLYHVLVSLMCLPLLSCVNVTHNVYAACIGMWLSEAVVKPYVFLCELLLLAGDIEQNHGPIQGRLRAGSCQHRCWMCYECTCVVVVACLVAVALMCSSGTVIT